MALLPRNGGNRMLANISGDRAPRLLHRYANLPNPKLDQIEDLANEALKGVVSSSALPLMTGLAVGFGIAGFSGMPIVGAAAAGYFLYNAANGAIQKGKETEYIKDVGILAHVLQEQNLVRYAEIVGVEAAANEILTAYQDGQNITPAARKLCQALGKTPKRRSIATFLEDIQQLQTLPDTTQLPSTPTSPIAPSTAGGTCKILTAVDDLVHPVRSSYISAPPRTGKGILIALAMRQFKQRYPNGMLYSYTPKQDPKEHWYWESSDQHFNPDLNQHPTRAAQSLYAMIRHWQSLPSTPETPILFVCDELSATLSRLKPVKMSDIDNTLFTDDTRSFSVWLLDFLIHEASMRQSVDRFVWVLTPLCTVQESGVSASALKSLRNYTLASRENLKFADGGTAAFAAPKNLHRPPTPHPLPNDRLLPRLPHLAPHPHRHSTQPRPPGPIHPKPQPLGRPPDRRLRPSLAIQRTRRRNLHPRLRSILHGHYGSNDRPHQHRTRSRQTRSTHHRLPMGDRPPRHRSHHHPSRLHQPRQKRPKIDLPKR